MEARQRVISLIIIMIAAVLIGVSVTIFLLYQAALDEERARLVETAQSQARLIEAIARHDAIYETGTPGGATAATLSQIRDAHSQYQGFGETGEFTLARRSGDFIYFVLNHRHLDLDNPQPIPFDSELAEPMRRALSGQSGTMTGLDYRGETVLAAYEPVAELDFGIVAKIDMAEIRKPFIRAAIIALISSVLVISAGVVLFLRISNPMLKRLEKARDELEIRVNERTAELSEANVVLMNEITERHQAEGDLRQRNAMLSAIDRAHSQFITESDSQVLFDHLLNDFLSLTNSEYGFIGEVLHTDENKPYLKTQVITNIAWNEETRQFYEDNAPTGLEFHNLDTLFGAVMTTGEMVISNSPYNDSRRGGLPEGHPPLNAFLGLPLYGNNELVGMVGIANRSVGYDEKLVTYLHPLLAVSGNIINEYRNIKLRHQAEEKLAKANQNMEAIFSSADETIFTLDMDRNILSCNPAGEKMLGCRESEIIGHTTARFYVSEETYLDFGEKLATALGERGVYSGEFELIRTNGERFPAEFTVSILKSEGQSLGLVAIIRDVTERKKTEEKIYEYEELNKLKDNLLSTVSHELRTPLASITGYISLMLEYSQRLTENEKQDYLKSMDQAANRLAELIEHLLDMSRLESGLLSLEKERISISELVREIADEASHRAPSHRIKVNASKRLPLVDIDARRIRQVLDNIIDNASKYSEEGTEIVLTVRRSGHEILISVTDHGIGIPAEELEMVFERMYRVKRTTPSHIGGIGLGLAICKGLVEAHEGRIWMESEEGKGSTCFFTIPI